jgi:hypothetical protein
MILGTLAMIAMHPIGRVYAIVTIAMALLLYGLPRETKRLLPLLLMTLFFIVSFILPKFIERPKMTSLPIMSLLSLNFRELVSLAVQSLTTIDNEIGKLIFPFGSIIVFGTLLCFGFLTTEREKQRAIFCTISILALILLASLFSIMSLNRPAEIFIRVFVPFYIILVGAVGQAIWYIFSFCVCTMTESGNNYSKNLETSLGIKIISKYKLKTLVLVMIIAISFGFLNFTSYCIQSLRAERKHMMFNQSMALNSSQPEILIKRAKSNDRVLYFDHILFPFYSMYGALQLGAVFYSIAAGKYEEARWLNGSDLRFAVSWTPVQVIPISHDGMIPLGSLRAIHIQTMKPLASTYLRLYVDNRGSVSQVEVTPITHQGDMLAIYKKRIDIPARWTGWVEVDMRNYPVTDTFQIIMVEQSQLSYQSTEFFPTKMAANQDRLPSVSKYSELYIGGIVFGDEPHFWPWKQKATLTLVTKEIGIEPFIVIFDPARILPFPLNSHEVSILDDHGSSVLFEIQPQNSNSK